MICIQNLMNQVLRKRDAEAEWAFTLIERAPNKARETSRMKRSDPTNCPFQVGSLTAVPRLAGRSAVTKSPVGKPQAWACPPTAGTRSQSERRDKQPGRRQTNVRKHRKGKLAGIADRASEFIGGRSPVRWEKPAITWEANGCAHQVTRRCKRRRHGRSVSLSNWGGPARFRLNARGKTPVWADPITQPETTAMTSPRRFVKSGCLGISRGIKCNAESRGKVLQGVGDAHSSVDDKDSITLSERRGISLRMLTLATGGLA